MPFLLFMPSYNQSHYITSAIDSILAQQDQDWELWIIDNSTDNTPQVVQGYSDPRIKFFHIPQRMDPGTCLNWALERAEGRDFSYVHTDNLLSPNYVGEMRKALAVDDFSLAYCDMRVINDDGKRVGIFRRGSFDLARLVSLSPLGVPFSATTALAKRLNGFSTADVADDVLFCLHAFGIAHCVHIPQALMDYRLHAGSRTTEQGGTSKMEAAFIRSYVRALPQMQANGTDPLKALEAAMRRCELDMDLAAEDNWYRNGHRTGVTLAKEANFDNLWSLAWFRLPDLKIRTLKTLRPRKTPVVASGYLTLLAAFVFHKRMRGLRGAINSKAIEFRNFVIPWAAMKMAHVGDHSVRCWLMSPDVLSLWTAYLLTKNLGWNIYIPPGDRGRYPYWVAFPEAPIPAHPESMDCALNLSKEVLTSSMPKGVVELTLHKMSDEDSAALLAPTILKRAS